MDEEAQNQRRDDIANRWIEWLNIISTAEGPARPGVVLRLDRYKTAPKPPWPFGFPSTAWTWRESGRSS